MEKPNIRGASPSRKAHLALREKLNRKSKPPPPFPEITPVPAAKPIRGGERKTHK
jgi:hypothetical protein